MIYNYNPKLSIIVPIYNAEKYLSRCIDSILAQTFKSFELLLIDDGSKDKSGEICDTYAKNDNRVKVIHKINEGAGIARNVGLSIAEGEYVGFVDADDYVSADMFKILFNEAKTEKYDAVFCGVNNVMDNGSITKTFTSDRRVYENDILLYIADMISASPMQKDISNESVAVWNGIYLIDIIKRNNINFKSERQVLSEDTLFNVEFLLSCKKVRKISTALCFHCYNETSLSSVFSRERIDYLNTLFLELNKLTIDINSHILRERILGLFINYCLLFISQIFFSDETIHNKRIYWSDILKLPQWIYVKNEYPISLCPIVKKIKLNLLLNNMFLTDYLLYSFYKSIKN